VTLRELGQERYVSLTTFRRVGTEVSTPVWVAPENGRLLVWSGVDAWKVRRIRRDGHVRVAPCSAGGKVRGAALEGQATILADTTLVQGLLAGKYGFMYRVIRLFTALGRAVLRKPEQKSVTIAIVPRRTSS